MVEIPPSEHPSTSIEHDSIASLKNYMPSASTMDVVERFSDGLRGYTNGRMLSITGPYGSGKSTMAMFLDGLLAGENSKEWDAAYRILLHNSHDLAYDLKHRRKKTGIHKRGMIRCAATARREPISATILRALDSGASKFFARYPKAGFARAADLHKCMAALRRGRVATSGDVIDIVRSMCDVAPVAIIIDEFGKSVEYFAADDVEQGDLFLLQELAEMSGKNRKIPLSIITLQHMAFEDYAAGASAAQRREWAKIQGRFEDIPFSNSPDQTRLLVSGMIRMAKNSRDFRRLSPWAKKEAKKMQDLGIDSGFDPDLIHSCYPLDPLSLEILPELCSRYGQHERTLLSFLSGAGRNTVSTFIAENSWDVKRAPPVMGVDRLYDYFISGTSMSYSSSANITRLMEIETIIRDSHGLDEAETLVLKTIGMLNLIGRSGNLRASKQLLDHAAGTDTSKILKKLQSKSIITYRDFADEYRIWHGTDVDIAAELDAARKRYKKARLSDMLRDVMSLEPVVAAKHGIETGTMRSFERHFMAGSQITLKEEYDGAIVYATDGSAIPECPKPVIRVTARATSDLQQAAVEVMAIRDILENGKRVAADWVARKELEERLADAEVRLDREFDRAYGRSAKWEHVRGGRFKPCKGTASSIASAVCDDAYSQAPRIHNEMINRTVLSTQGSSARRILLERMILDTAKPKFGIEGYGPERAVYEAIFFKHGIHRPGKDLGWNLYGPENQEIRPVWDAILGMVAGSKKRVRLSGIYAACKVPPYGVKDGVALVLVMAVFLTHKNNMALYEHGTFVPRVQPETAERMAKNPENYELKYFKSTPSKKLLLDTLAADLDLEQTASVLNVVGKMARTVSALHPYVSKTKRLDKDTLAIRNAIMEAREPDTLLFESLPKALGYRSFETRITKQDVAGFSKTVAESINRLQGEFGNMLSGLTGMLLESTGMEDRKSLSKAARQMLQNVTDQKMRVFLNALTTDPLPDEDWAKYVAMSLTDLPPDNWTDDQREMYENNLSAMSAKFKRLASIHFSKISDNLAKPSFQITVTNSDGKEHHSVVSLRPEQRKKVEKMAHSLLAKMKKEGFTDRDIEALVAILSSRDGTQLHL